MALMVPPVVVTLLVSLVNLGVRRVAPRFALTEGELIVMTLNEGVLGKANMFDLARRTVRFTPSAA